MRSRQGNNPKRRVMEVEAATSELLDEIASKVKYVGSGHHKRHPANYGFTVTNPIPTKSLCDLNRTIMQEEAQALILAGIERAMISVPQQDDMPKYIWAVTDEDEVFEAKTHINTPWQYHGYPLGDNDQAMKNYILEVWKTRHA